MVSANREAIPRYGLFELSLTRSDVYAKPFFDVALEVVFTAPDGGQRAIKGFYYGGGTWKVRFRPDQQGFWSYAYTVKAQQDIRNRGTGSFQCRPSIDDGAVRRDPANPYRWVFSDGKPYFPIGLQDCMAIAGSKLTGGVIDGEGRNEQGKNISLKAYFNTYGKAGFNLFRFSQKNCSYAIYDDLDHYREAESLITDELLSTARDNGFRIMFGLFGNHLNAVPGNKLFDLFNRVVDKAMRINTNPVWSPSSNEIISKERRFIDYAVARWGVYVDFWELLNERHASDEWLTSTARYLRSVDLDRKPISTSWEKPHLVAIDINAPHWYESESEFESDARVVQQAAQWKQWGKPVIVGEHGNTGMNWDPRSATRMRIRLWTALFDEISLVFWNTSWSKAGMFQGQYTPGGWANIYLGPEERRYVRVLRDFSSHLPAGLRPSEVEVSLPRQVRAYSVRANEIAAVYLHHFDSHQSAIENLKVSFDNPTPAVAQWIDPATGETVSDVRLSPGRQTLAVPPIKIDLALLVRGHTKQMSQPKQSLKTGSYRGSRL